MEKNRILIVEDDAATALNLKIILTDLNYEVICITSSGEDAISIALKEEPDLILMDIILEREIDGIDAAVEIHKTRNVPVIFITANSDESIVSRAKEAAPYGFIIKPFNKRELRTIVTLAIHRYTLENKLTESLDTLKKTLDGAIQAIAKIVDFRDPFTAGHQRRVGQLAEKIAQTMKFDKNTIESIFVAGTIHDIGKIAIPSEILSKPTKLNKSEFSLIKNHPTTGFDILKDIGLPSKVPEIILQHHERIDGSGYPRNLTGDEVLMESKIMSISDVIEAMISHRPYRPSLDINIALEEVSKKSNLYDKELARICLHLFNEEKFQFNS